MRKRSMIGAALLAAIGVGVGTGVYLGKPSADRAVWFPIDADSPDAKKAAGDAATLVDRVPLVGDIVVVPLSNKAGDTIACIALVKALPTVQTDPITVELIAVTDYGNSVAKAYLPKKGTQFKPYLQQTTKVLVRAKAA